MDYYAGIDVSLELSSVCIVDAAGKVVKESKVETHPDALVKFFKNLGLPLTRIGLEAGPLSQWLHGGLIAAGFETVLMETRHVKKALSASRVKTDRRDARGIAQLLRLGWFRPVHAKSVGSQEVRALLVARKQLQHKLTDIELSIRGIPGGITRVGDEMVRTALYEAANVLLLPRTRFSPLKRWGLEVAKRRGSKRAKVAVARKLAVILHRMWIDGTTFRWTKTATAQA